MAQVSFCCSDSRGRLLDRVIADVNDFFEARDYAKEVVWFFIKTARLADWRSCRLHVRDDRGEEIFVMPFSWALERRQRLVSFWQRTDALNF